MEKRLILAISILSILIVCETFAAVWPPKVIRSVGYIGDGAEVRSLSIWIADFMADLLSPNFDYSGDASRWQTALNDLVNAQLTPPPNSEITHVQMRIWYRCEGIYTDQTAWTNPRLGAYDPGAQNIVNNYQRWFFGSPAPTYGPSAIERIHNAGLKMEFAISAAWNGRDPDKPAPLQRPGMGGSTGREADYPGWMAAGGGEAFLRNYYANVLKPVSEFLAANPYFGDGDVFSVSFEMAYPEADFTWLHNDAWSRIINGGTVWKGVSAPYLDDDPSKPGLRKIFEDAGKGGVLLCQHYQGWFSDFGLGYNAVHFLNPAARLGPEYQGISGASYLSAFDYVAISQWTEVLVSSIPGVPPDGTPWDETGRFLYRDGWFNDLNFAKTGEQSVLGRDFMADYAALSTILDGTKLLMNTGWQARHFAGVDQWTGGTLDHTAQREAWAGQLLALQNQTWCAGQDFERYTEDKTARPTDVRESWRRSIAEPVIIETIRHIVTGF